MNLKETLALCIAVLLGGCGGESERVVSGYAEAEYVYVAAPEGGWLTEVLVKRGAQVKTGDPLFALDAEAQLAERTRASAQVKQAEAQLANAKRARRPDEIEALKATRARAKAGLDLAESELKRTAELVTRGFASKATLDQKKAERNSTLAQLKEAEANLDLARKSVSRPDEVAAAEANVLAAKAALERAEYALSQRRIHTKVSARVEDTLRRTGEFVPPAGAVVQLLPPQNVKVRFFVPEAERAKLQVGTIVPIGCDGCPKGLKARVTFISADAEFTPPVIYSVGSREKLVWMVEASPEVAGALSPGQPVDVALP